MIYVTGDLHGDIERFRSKECGRLKRGDTLIVCGDFGFLWDGSDKERKLLKWIGRRRYQVLFVEGVHDNLSLLSEYPKETWCGGETRLISGKLRHLCRGGIFDIEGCKIFAFGGGETPPSGMLDNMTDWQEERLPSIDEVAAARENLAAHGGKIDYIITHQCSRKLKKLLSMEEDEANILDTFFDEIRGNCGYRTWYFGSYHIDRVVPPSEVALFRRIAPVGEAVPFANTNSGKQHRII